MIILWKITELRKGKKKKMQTEKSGSPSGNVEKIKLESRNLSVFV